MGDLPSHGITPAGSLRGADGSLTPLTVEALTERVARVEHKLALAEKERDDALKALGTVYVGKLKEGRA